MSNARWRHRNGTGFAFSPASILQQLPTANEALIRITQVLGMKKTRKLLAIPVMLLVLAAATVRGQSALDGFDPNANGTVRVVVVQPDGKILIGGDFTKLSPNGGSAVTRTNIARLNPDGTLDTAFNANANGEVFSIAVQADGKILVGGTFSGANSMGGRNRNYIARLDATTGSADSFDPNASAPVYSIVVQPDGKILAGGDFTSIGGRRRKHIARLDAANGLADSFDPNANGSVVSIAVQADGRILVGGWFNGSNSMGGQNRNYIARLEATTGLADSFDPNANGLVRSIAVQADGKILAGGFFFGANSIGGQTRNRIARLDATTGSADSFNPNATDEVFSIAVQADGKILAGGFFTNIGGQTRNHIARLDATTGLADSLNPSANNNIVSIAVQADGKILAGGYFSGANSIGGQTRNCIARLESDGRLDQMLNPSVSGYVTATAVQPDGKIVIGGFFASVLGVTRRSIARLNTDGTLDDAFNPNADNEVRSIAVQADGKILVGGFFTTIGGEVRNRMARLDATTGLADSFAPEPNGSGWVLSIAIQEDGKILAGGSFSTIGGQPRNNIARLDATTGLADSFNPNANGQVYSTVVQPDGKILAGGLFNTIGGQVRNKIARLDATTGLADSFNPNANDYVISIAVQADGNVLAGGVFSSIGGQMRNRIARLDAATGLADSFNPNASSAVDSIAIQQDGKILVGGDFNGVNSIGGQRRNYVARLAPATGLADSFDPNANNTVYSITVQVDGKILVGGAFFGANSMGGQTRNHFTRLSNDTAALQDLAVTPTDITWTRGGSSAQFTRVTFESSNDNVNYAPLGSGAALGSNWTLTGLNLPTGQNFYIRARGYHRSGYQNGSESITESVLNAFLAAPTPTPTLTPAATPTPTPTATVTLPPVATPTPTLTPTPTSTPSPTPTPGSTPTATPSSTPTPMPTPASQAVNLSTRMRVQTGNSVGIGGFIITGSTPKHVVLRAIGPSLVNLGVPDALADPVLELHGPGGFVTITNDNWRDDPVQAALIQADGLAPVDDLESALDATLAPGAYTAIVRGKNNTSGVALIEIYDRNPSVTSKLGNMSTRAFCGTGDSIVIAGFMLGSNSGEDKVVVRGIGPSLAPGSLPASAVLADPMLELRDINGTLLMVNNDWQDDPAQAAEITATGLAPANSSESAIAAALPPGLYTALLAGLNSGTGIGLVEVYDRGAP